MRKVYAKWFPVITPVKSPRRKISFVYVQVVADLGIKCVWQLSETF